MVGKRKRHRPEFKSKIALLAIKGEQRINEIASQYELHPGQIIQWKQQLLLQAAELFSTGAKQRGQAEEELRNQLYQEIGQLKVELDWLKKRSELSVEELRGMIDCESELSISRQCSLLGLSRSSYYYESGGDISEDLALMRLLDEQDLRTPFYGIRRMTEWLRRQG